MTPDLRPTRHVYIAPRSTFGRISDALGSPRMFTFYLGFYSGCMATVGLAFVWSRFL